MASAYTSGYDRVFQISAGVTIVALLVSFALPRSTGARLLAAAPSPRPRRRYRWSRPDLAAGVATTRG